LATKNLALLELDKLDKIEGGREELQKKVKGLQKRIKYQKCQIEDYRELVEEGKVEFEKVYQDCEIGFWVKKRKFFLLNRTVMMLKCL
jgi:hypothetical protein